MRRGRTSVDLAIAIALKVFAVIVFAFIFTPIAVLIVFSFNVDRYPSIPWTGSSLQWYRSLLTDPSILDATINTLIVAGCVAPLSTVLGATAAYFMRRWNFPGKAIYSLVAASPPTLPFMILGLSLLLYFTQFGIGGNLQAAIIGQSVLFAPFAMGVVTLRLFLMDSQIEEVSWNLGGGEWYTFRRVVLPQIRSALFIALVLTFALSLDEFVIAWFVAGLSQTIPVKIYAMVGYSVTPQINAIGTIVFVVSQTLVCAAAMLWRRSVPSREGLSE